MLFGIDDGLVNGNVNMADVFFLVAMIVFIVAAVIRFLAHAWDSAFVATGLAVLSLAWLVL